MPSDSDYAVMAFGRGDRKEQTVKLVNEAINNETNAMRSKWIYFDTLDPEHGTDVLLLFPDGSVCSHKIHREHLQYPQAVAWMVAPEKRKNWVPCKPNSELFGGADYKECRFKRGENDNWMIGFVEAISLNGKAFLCRRVGEDGGWVGTCEVVACQ